MMSDDNRIDHGGPENTKEDAMTDDPKQMMFLVGLADGLITFAEEKLDATPFTLGDETRIRFWASLLNKAQNKYMEETEKLAKATSR